LPPNGFEQFVLKPFAPFEEKLKEEGMQRAMSIIDALKTKTFEEVMNVWN